MRESVTAGCRAILAMGLVTAMACAETYDPVADPQAVVVSGKARFTILTSRMIRLEFAPGGRFEDRASLGFVNRRLEPPKFETERAEGWLTIRTEHLELRYREGGGAFDAGNLTITLRGSEPPVVWRPGLVDEGNLRGTTRTLDGVSGSWPLEPGLLSRSGWAVADESGRPVFAEAGRFAARHEPDALDWYFFGYGLDFSDALKDFTRVAGRIPLPPRYVFGSWWSRYWAYSADELKALVEDFDRHDVPLDVLVIDMDWHLDGWTGYTWNPEYFPDPAGFLAWVRARGLRTTLNLHPADGVGRHESQFADFCATLGLDPETTTRVPFDCTDPRYMDAYFRLLHHPHEALGVDFWWIDWQQGEESKLAGLDPLFALNHLHWHDQAGRTAQTSRRPLIFSRWGGLGNHRYPIGFSGDTYCDWPSLTFQPYFTATAGNVGYAYWSHDIGGHQPGKVDPELYTRWVQWGALSPILRTHTTKHAEAERRIWKFDLPYFEAMRAAFHLRYELIPYLYTQARRTYDTGLPLCRPMYLEWPTLEAAYVYSNQYMLGDDLLVAPITTPRDPAFERAVARVWLPPGDWVNWFTGRTYHGDQVVTLLAPLDEIPLFVRAGAVIPLQPRSLRSTPPAEAPLVFAVFPGEHGVCRRYDDSGDGPGYDQDCEWTPVSQEHSPGQRIVTIGPVAGRRPDGPPAHALELRLCYLRPPDEIAVNGIVVPRTEPASASGWWYDLETFTTIVRIPPQPRDAAVTVLVTEPPEDLDDITLRKGLREQVKLLRSVAGYLGRSTPQTIREALEFMGRGPHNARYWTHNIVVRWPHILMDTSRLILDEPLRGAALVRLCGLAAELDAVVSPDAPNELIGRLHVTPTLDIPVLKQLSGALRITNDAGWSVIGDSISHFYDITEGTVATLPVRFQTDGTLQTATLTGHVRVQFAEMRAELEMSRVILPSINNWWVIGPFELPNQSLLRPFTPETAFEPETEYDGKYGLPVRWTPCQRRFKPGARLTDEHFVHLHEFFGRRSENAVAYALTFLHSPREQEAVLAFGTDDGAVVWLNGEEIYRQDVGRAYSPRSERVRLRLRAGANQLRLKIGQHGGDWGFGAHVETLDGKPLTEVKSYLAP